MLLDLQYQHLFSSDALFGRVTDFFSHDTVARPQVYAQLETTQNTAQFDLEISNEGRGGSEVWYQEKVRIQSNDGSVWNALGLSNSVLLQTKWQMSWR